MFLRLAVCGFVSILIAWIGVVVCVMLFITRGPIGQAADGSRTIRALVTASDGGELRVIDGGFQLSGPIEAQFLLTAHPALIPLFVIPLIVIACLALFGAWHLAGRINGK